MSMSRHGMNIAGILTCMCHAQRCWDQGGGAAAAAAPNLAALAVLAEDFRTASAHAEAALSVQQPSSAAYVAAAAVALQVLSCINAAHAAGSEGAQLLRDSGHMIRPKLCHLQTGRRCGDSAAALPGGSGRRPRLQRGTLQPRVRVSLNAASAAAPTRKTFYQDISPSPFYQPCGSSMSISIPSASVRRGPDDIVQQSGCVTCSLAARRLKLLNEALRAFRACSARGSATPDMGPQLQVCSRVLRSAFARCGLQTHPSSTNWQVYFLGPA